MSNHFTILSECNESKDLFMMMKRSFDSVRYAHSAQDDKERA
jgi:hypothetical protein